MQNFGYLIGDEKTKQALIVDPAWDPTLIMNTVSEAGFKLAGLVVTHAHYDHVNAIEILLKKLDIPVYANKNEIPYAKAGHSIVGSLGRTVKALDNEQDLQLGETSIYFFHTPGHTPGSQCLRVGDQLITGDTLFVGGCGRSDLPGGDPVVLFHTLEKLARLPRQLEICPGHDYGDQPRRLLQDELELNPYLRFKDARSFVEATG
ncbi:MAG: putative polyketide biosynthesis zinc-dependent hydrolase PksB [Elusimicrobia bacterium]|nr:putative polyketide biosynthesis zinc-dependent hydrolase PksB [Elusimicrobiota bacterium]